MVRRSDTAIANSTKLVGVRMCFLLSTMMMSALQMKVTANTIGMMYP